MAISLLGTYKNKLIFITCWVVWSLVHALLLTSWQVGWMVSFGDSVLSNLLLCAACLLVSNNLRFYRPRKGRYVYVLVVCVVVSGLWLAIIQYTLTHVFDKEVSYLRFLEGSYSIRYTISVLVIGCMWLVSELWYTLEEYKETEQRSRDAVQMAKDAELYKLRQQLQPHFLFNSLNSISALIVMKPEQARRMIQQLSDFLRGTLKKEEHQWTSLSEELEHLGLYLEIEKVRFGHRLHTHIDSSEAANRHLVPHMILQPLVENAIKFGLYDTTGDVDILISAEVKEQYLEVVVQNPYDASTAFPRSGTGFGLRGVERRLYLLFSRQDLLTTSASGDVFVTKVKIPRV